jgi:hypothetical protein
MRVAFVDAVYTLVLTVGEVLKLLLSAARSYVCFFALE